MQLVWGQLGAAKANVILGVQPLRRKQSWQLQRGEQVGKAGFSVIAKWCHGWVRQLPTRTGAALELGGGEELVLLG